MLRLLERVDLEKLDAARERQDALAAQASIHDVLFGDPADIE